MYSEQWLEGSIHGGGEVGIAGVPCWRPSRCHLCWRRSWLRYER